MPGRLSSSSRLPALSLFLCTALALPGCSLLKKKDEASAADDGTRVLSSADAQERPAGDGRDAFTLEVRAPDEIRDYLTRHMELQRYRSLADLDARELSRLLGAAEANARELLATLGYFAPRLTLDMQETPEAKAPRRIVVAVDPPSGSGENSCCGIVVAGVEASEGSPGRAVVLADCSVTGQTPGGWAKAVVKAYSRFSADRVVAEGNQGGDMVPAMLKSIDANLPVTVVHASRGKFARAEPVAALYEQGRVVHAGRFAELEDQMCDFGPNGLSSGRSPDRLDALVWALTALVLDGQGEPRVRGI